MKRPVRLGKRLMCTVLCLAVVLAMALPVWAEEAGQREQRFAAAVYRNPREDGAVIGYLQPQTPITVLETVGQYHKIDCYDMTGYIRVDQTEPWEEGWRVLGDTEYPARLWTLPAEKWEEKVRLIADTAVRYVGVPYVWGGTTPRGFDCSGFTQYVMRKCGITIPRSCEGQLSDGLIISKEELHCGDLVLFTGTTGVWGVVSHVGLYLGDGKLIHAGSRGITVVELESDYFVRHYLCARRFLEGGAAAEQPQLQVQLLAE